MGNTTVLPSRLFITHSAISLIGGIPKLTRVERRGNTDTQVDEREQVFLRSRPRQADEQQIMEHSCRIPADPSLYDVQSRLEQDDSDGAGGSV